MATIINYISIINIYIIGDTQRASLHAWSRLLNSQYFNWMNNLCRLAIQLVGHKFDRYPPIAIYIYYIPFGYLT